MNMAVVMVTYVPDYLQFTGKHGDCCGDFGTTMFNLLANMAAVMVTCVQLSSVSW